VPFVKRIVTLLAGLAGGALAAVAFRRRRGASEAGVEAPERRAEELRRKLSQAREAAADEEDFRAAEMGGDTVAADQPPVRPTREDADSLRQEVHERGREAADDMRRTSDGE
jgi:hypothetical protein